MKLGSPPPFPYLASVLGQSHRMGFRMHLESPVEKSKFDGAVFGTRETWLCL